jgi:hypothetical protein
MFWKDSFYLFILNERFPKTWFLNSFISYHTLHPILRTAPYVQIIVLFWS